MHTSTDVFAKARDHDRAEHDPLGALHLDDRHRRRGEHVEVRQDVRLARGREQLGAIVVAHLCEDVG